MQEELLQQYSHCVIACNETRHFSELGKTCGLFHALRLPEVPAIMRIDDEKTRSNAETKEGHKGISGAQPVQIHMGGGRDDRPHQLVGLHKCTDSFVDIPRLWRSQYIRRLALSSHRMLEQPGKPAHNPPRRHDNR